MDELHVFNSVRVYILRGFLQKACEKQCYCRCPQATVTLACAKTQAGKLPVPGDFSQGLSGEDRQGIDLYHFQDQQVPGMQGPGNSDQSRFMQVSLLPPYHSSQDHKALS